MSKETKVAEIKADSEMAIKLIDLAKEAMSNPVVEIILAYLVIEAAQRRGLLPDVAGNVAEGGVLTAVAWQQIAPSVPYLVQGGTELLKSLASAAPMLIK